MIRILGIAGSLRRRSFNRALLEATAGLMPQGASLDIASIEGIPLYNADEEEADGLPQAVVALKDAITAADGLILATPEYNNGIPGVFKNAIDWASRPPRDIKRVFGGKPVALMGTSPGAFGTVLAQSGWLPVLRTLGTQPWFEGRLIVPHAGQVFDGDSHLTDEAVLGRLRGFVTDYVEFVRNGRP